MIYNDKQLEITKKNLRKFQDSLTKIQSGYNDDPLFRNVMSDATKSQIEELKSEIEAYECLISGNYNFQEIYTIDELRNDLTKRRISCKVSEEKMAKFLGLGLIEFQRLEDSQYKGASQEILGRAAKYLELEVEEKNSQNLLPAFRIRG